MESTAIRFSMGTNVFEWLWQFISLGIGVLIIALIITTLILLIKKLRK